jgi:anti-sigma factor (TIGR02949 family)
MSNEALEYNQCQEAVKRLNDYLSRELDASEQTLVQKHLSECTGCFERFRFEDTLLRTIRERVSQTKAPEALRSRIVSLLGAR